METKTNPCSALPSYAECCVKNLHKTKFENCFKQKQANWLSTKPKLLLLYCLLSISYGGFSQLQISTSDICGGNVCQNGTDEITISVIGGAYTLPLTYKWNTNPNTVTTTNSLQNTIQVHSSFISSPQYNTSTAGSKTIGCTITDASTPVKSISTTFNYNVVTVSHAGFPAITLNSNPTCPYDTVKLSPGNFQTSSTMSSNYFIGGANQVLPTTLPATYTVAVSNTAVHCSTVESFVLNPAITSCGTYIRGYSAINSPVTIASQNQLPTNNLILNANITIAGNIALNNRNILIAPGVTIFVQPGATLSISGSYLHACGCMWYGIVLEGSSTGAGAVNISNASIIEDAIYAISNDGSNSSPKITVSNTLFNKNDVGIYLYDNPNNLSANVSVTNSIFTCRSINSPNIYGHLNSFTNTLFSNFQTNWATLNAYYPTTLTNYNHLSNQGIYMLNCPSVPGISIGNNNIFDNLNYGVLAFQTNFSASGNQF